MNAGTAETLWGLARPKFRSCKRGTKLAWVRHAAREAEPAAETARFRPSPVLRNHETTAGSWISPEILVGRRWPFQLVACLDVDARVSLAVGFRLKHR